MRGFLGLLLLGAAAATAQSRPPPGYRIFDSGRGFTAWTSVRFRQIPTQPGEKIVVGRFVRKGRRKETKRLRFRPYYLYLVLKGKEAKTAPEAVASRFLGTGFRLRRRRLRRVPLPPGATVVEFHAVQPKGKREGVVVLYRYKAALVVFLGVTHRNDFDRDGPLFRRLGHSVRFGAAPRRRAPPAPDPYQGSRLPGIPYRRTIRARLVPGWRAADTEHYIVVYHTRDRALLRKLLRDLEILHAYYRRLFPPKKPITAVSTVRVCKDREEYIHYGGSPMSAGYWNYRTEELVMYDNKKGDFGSKLGNRDTFIVLYHEAFHQYVYYSAGEMAPHVWYNEGTADFFSGVVIARRRPKVLRVDPHPWRARRIRAAVRAGTYVPFKQFFRMTKRQYYANGPLNYAQGWSVVYFLLTSRAVAKNPAWAKVHGTYFRTLRDTYAALTAKLGEDDEEGRRKAAAEARKKAYEAAFAGVDLEALEKAWRKFVLRLRVPRF